MSFPRVPVVFPATVESRPVAESTWGSKAKVRTLRKCGESVL